MRYAAFLRAVNLGARNRISMADLRAILASLGYDDVATYVQSGNAVFTGRRFSTNKIATQLEDTLDGELGLKVSVLIRTAEEVATVIAKNPFLPKHDVAHLHAGFLSSSPPVAAQQQLDVARFEPDACAFGDRVMYLCYPNGLGRSKMNGYLTEKRLGVTATVRNWRTVANVDQMLRD